MDRRISGPRRDWLTAEEAGRYMGLSEDVFQELVKEGRLPAAAQVSKGRRLWNWLDVVAYMHLVSRSTGQLLPTTPERTRSEK